MPEPPIVWRIQVELSEGNWINVGPPYATKEAAQGWRSFVKAAWHARHVRVRAEAKGA